MTNLELSQLCLFNIFKMSGKKFKTLLNWDLEEWDLGGLFGIILKP